MKKFLKIGAALAALVLGLVCFAACSNGDDDGGGRSGNGGGSDNQESEKPRVTVVATYQDIDYSSYHYVFYSDGTYEYSQGKIPLETGNYYGSPTKRGTVTMQRQKLFDEDVADLISNPKNYKIIIDKKGDDLCFEDDYGYSYFLN